jgi:hypothetical protein
MSTSHFNREPRRLRLRAMADITGKATLLAHERPGIHEAMRRCRRSSRRQRRMTRRRPATSTATAARSGASPPAITPAAGTTSTTVKRLLGAPEVARQRVLLCANSGSRESAPARLPLSCKRQCAFAGGLARKAVRRARPLRPRGSRRPRASPTRPPPQGAAERDPRGKPRPARLAGSGPRAFSIARRPLLSMNSNPRGRPRTDRPVVSIAASSARSTAGTAATSTSPRSARPVSASVSPPSSARTRDRNGTPGGRG